MRYPIAILVGLHGVAHLVGFIASFRLMSLPELPYKTTVLNGHLDVGDSGVRVFGVLWLVVALLCVNAAVAIWFELPWARPFTLGTLFASFVLCAMGWPEARIGLFLSGALLAFLVVVPRLGLRVLMGP